VARHGLGGAAGFRPCLEPPIVPASCASCHDNWEIMMYKAGDHGDHGDHQKIMEGMAGFLGRWVYYGHL